MVAGIFCHDGGGAAGLGLETLLHDGSGAHGFDVYVWLG
jgi:hypothetical protein